MSNTYTRLHDEGIQMYESESAWESQLEEAMDRAERDEDTSDLDRYTKEWN